MGPPWMDPRRLLVVSLLNGKVSGHREKGWAGENQMETGMPLIWLLNLCTLQSLTSKWGDQLCF